MDLAGRRHALPGQEVEGLAMPPRSHPGIAVIDHVNEEVSTALRHRPADQRQGAIFVVEVGEDVDDGHVRATHHDCLPAPRRAFALLIGGRAPYQTDPRLTGSGGFLAGGCRG
jgi:hypothetical protein